MKICNRITLGALAAAALAAASACKEESKAPPPPPAPPPSAAPAAPTPSAPAATPPAAAPATQAGSGTIEGSVAFAGTPPEMKQLPTTADAKCPKSVKNEDALVHNGKLANVWVHVTKGGTAGGEAPKSIEVTQHGCMYRPRMQTV